MNKFYALPGTFHRVRLAAINEIEVGENEVRLWVDGCDDCTKIPCANKEVAETVAKDIHSACEKDAEGAAVGRELDEFVRWMSSKARA